MPNCELLHDALSLQLRRCAWASYVNLCALSRQALLDALPCQLSDLDLMLATGDIDSHASERLILNDAKVPPFQLEVAGSENLADESTRLKYRYLDLRRPQLRRA